MVRIKILINPPRELRRVIKNWQKSSSYAPPSPSKPIKLPVEPFAFIRVCNEKKTLLCSLNSIFPAITKGVIAYMNCKDGSEEIILKFCEKHPGFVPAKYDYYDLYPDEDKGSRLSRYYNWTLALLPKNEWVIKIDADQIYNSEILSKIFRMPKYDDDLVILPRLQLHYGGDNLYVYKKRPFNFSHDHWLFYNRDGLSFYPIVGRYETIEIPHRRLLIAEISNYHFQAIRPPRVLLPGDLMPFDDYVKNFDGKISDSFVGKEIYDVGLLDKKMLAKDYIMQFVRQFDFS